MAGKVLLQQWDYQVLMVRKVTVDLLVSLVLMVDQVYQVPKDSVEMLDQMDLLVPLEVLVNLLSRLKKEQLVLKD